MEEIRLQVYLARCGVASRRASENLILNGRVTVDGKTVTELGTKVSGNEKICFDGKQIFPEVEKRYILLNKPEGYVCSLADEKDRPIAASLLKDTYTERLYNIGRLDMLSGGAIIFTNDGDFSARVEHPSSEIEKEYEVITVFEYPDEVLQKFLRGVRIEGVFYKALSAERLAKNKMRIVLIEGKNREIRRVLKFFNIKIKKLTRVRIGCVHLSDLPPGKHRPLTPEEIKGLLG
ncbi:MULTISPECIES: pseudouridine synthase [unclassified Treponema]|uniref:pseudouridine synthase n=1 Tax=unclassified Treponema TaxID=2638727 RepID=UPI0020A2EF9B|nr:MULTISPECIES: pseudouridine synthase [unclassified Treponema]UTC66330.1 rRNA pseudouridine synthase [Treponema sp. OMZ 789]UTC69060.1 rRNA pseudouridine synthase [Treponema sp. OMZ 790]UTC71772.1 rRNA pseudouridine synthase [Treponema sp. OMZ 791]